jgi:hypothetical protein
MASILPRRASAAPLAPDKIETSEGSGSGGPGPTLWAASCRDSSFSDSQGVTIRATASDSSMPTEALIGIGRM